MNRVSEKVWIQGIVALSVLGAAFVVGVATTERAAGDRPEQKVVIPKGNSTLAAAERFVKFPVYFLGQEFEGLSLTGVERQFGPPLGDLPSGVDNMTFAYGTCSVRLDTDNPSCAPPLIVVGWDACQWRDDLQRFSPDERLRFRGAEAAFYEGFRRLEIYLNRVTVVMFGAGREALLRAAGSLRGVNNGVGPRTSFPASQTRAGRRRDC